jgi:hypothetical protein
MEVPVLRVATSELGVEFGAGVGGTSDEPDDLEAGQLVISEGVRTAHVTGADAEDTNGGLAHAPSITLPSSASSREKAPNRN